MVKELKASQVGVRQGERWILREATLTVPCGKVIGLTGPSGVGKTTLARAMAGLRRPDHGEVVVDGRPQRFRPRRSRRQVGMLFQSPRRSCNPSFTLEAIITEPLRGKALRPATLGGVLDEVQLDAALLQRRPGEVSEGQLQRACLARAFVADFNYLICDEATAMLDPITTAVIARALRARVETGSLGVLAISHDHELLHVWADRTARLGDQGICDEGICGP